MEGENVSKVAEFKDYLADVRVELRKVVWPTRKDTTATTMVVLGMVVLMSLFLWGVDWILSLIVKTIIQ